MVLNIMPCSSYIGVNFLVIALIISLGVKRIDSASRARFTRDRTASTSSWVWPTTRWLWLAVLNVRDSTSAVISREQWPFLISWCTVIQIEIATRPGPTVRQKWRPNQAKVVLKTRQRILYRIIALEHHPRTSDGMNIKCDKFDPYLPFPPTKRKHKLQTESIAKVLTWKWFSLLGCAIVGFLQGSHDLSSESRMSSMYCWHVVANNEKLLTQHSKFQLKDFYQQGTHSQFQLLPSVRASLERYMKHPCPWTITAVRVK